MSLTGWIAFPLRHGKNVILNSVQAITNRETSLVHIMTSQLSIYFKCQISHWKYIKNICKFANKKNTHTNSRFYFIIYQGIKRTKILFFKLTVTLKPNIFLPGSLPAIKNRFSFQAFKF